MRYRNRRLKQTVERTKEFLTVSRFSKAKDHLKEYSSDSELYFLQLNDKQFIVVNHFACNAGIEMQGFDLWLSNYERASEIGTAKASSIVGLKKGVRFPADEGLLEREISRLTNILIE